MKHGRIFLFLLSFSASVLLFGGCGKQGGMGSSNTTTVSSAKLPSETAADTEETATGKMPDNGSTIVIYTPHDADPMNAAINEFMEKYPDITAEVTAGGTGELCDKIESEKSFPKADVLWGGGADSLSAYSDLFESFTTKNDSVINGQFRDANHKWIGESPLPMVIIYNKKRLKEAGINAPDSWADCLKPEFRGEIAYCDPAKSGSAYTQLCTMVLANGGRENGWDYVRKFCESLDGKILDSSGKCHKMVASGDYLIGITIEKSAMTYADNPDIGYCYPSEGTSAVPDSTAIVKGCPHKDNAQIFADFVTSYECQTLQSQKWGRRPSRNDCTPPAGLKSVSDISLVNYDFEWAAKDKEENIARFETFMKK